MEKRLRFGDLVLRLMEHEVHCRGVTKYIGDKLILQSERMLFLRPMFNGLLSVLFFCLLPNTYQVQLSIGSTTMLKLSLFAGGCEQKAKTLPYRQTILEY